MKKTAASIFALLLCAVMVLGLALPAAAATYPSGSWEKVNIDGHNTYAWVLDTPVKNCNSFVVEFDVSMNAGARVYNWNILVSSGSEYKKVGSLYLSDGEGSATATVRLNPAMTVKRIVVRPVASGNYSYQFDLSVRDLSTSSSSSGSSSSQSSRPTNTLNGSWKTIKIDTGYGNYNVGSFMFDTALKKVKSLTLDVDVQMKAGCSCKTWTVWKVRGESATKIGTITVPDGNGAGTATIKFSNPQTVEGIAITPNVSGSYTWEEYLYVYDVKY